MRAIVLTSFAPGSSGAPRASRRMQGETMRRLNLALVLALTVPLGTLIGWIGGVGGRPGGTPMPG